MVEAQPITNFDYLLILDFEAQCDNDPNKKFDVQEIIEFPVVFLDLQKNEIIKELEFHYYIKPSNYPELTEFCKDLTKITQQQVDNGVDLKQAIDLLDAHLNKHNINQKQFTFCTCGDWDLFTCLRKETDFKKITYPDYLKRYINIKKVFEAQFNEKAFGMDSMLQKLGLQLIGTHHSGIDDARNIARIAQKIIELGYKFNSTFERDYTQEKFYQKKLKAEERQIENQKQIEKHKNK